MLPCTATPAATTGAISAAPTAPASAASVAPAVLAFAATSVGRRVGVAVPRRCQRPVYLLVDELALIGGGWAREGVLVAAGVEASWQAAVGCCVI